MFTKALIIAVFGINLALTLSNRRQNKIQDHKLDIDIETLTIGGHQFTLHETEESKKLSTNPTNVHPKRLATWNGVLVQFNTLEGSINSSSLSNKTQAMEVLRKVEKAFNKVFIHGEPAFHELGDAFQLLAAEIENNMIYYSSGSYEQSIKALKWLEDIATSRKAAFVKKRLAQFKADWSTVKAAFTLLQANIAEIFKAQIKSYKSSNRTTMVTIDGQTIHLNAVSLKVTSLLNSLKSIYESIVVKDQELYAEYRKVFENLTHVFDELEPSLEVGFEESISTLELFSWTISVHEELNKYKTVLVEPYDMVSGVEENFELADVDESDSSEDYSTQDYQESVPLYNVNIE